MANGPFQDSVAVVTGGASGIGKALCDRHLRQRHLRRRHAGGHARPHPLQIPGRRRRGPEASARRGAQPAGHRLPLLRPSPLVALPPPPADRRERQPQDRAGVPAATVARNREDMTILRLRGTAAGRSAAVGFDRLLGGVANATDSSRGFGEQVVQLSHPHDLAASGASSAVRQDRRAPLQERPVGGLRRGLVRPP